MKKLLIVAIALFTAHVLCMEQEVQKDEEALTQQIAALQLTPSQDEEPQQQAAVQPAAGPEQQAVIAERAADLHRKIVEFLATVNEHNEGLRPYIFIEAALYYWNHAKRLYNEAPNEQTKKVMLYARHVFYRLYEKQIADLMDIEFDQLYEYQQEIVIDQLTKLLADYYMTILEDPLAKTETKENIQETLTIARQNAGLEQ